MSITLVIRLPSLPTADTTALVEAVRPLIAPALLAAAEAAGVGVLGRLLLTVALRAAGNALTA